MGRIPSTEEAEVPQSGEPVASFPPTTGSFPAHYQAEESSSVGIPWSTGLFDCDQHQTNAVMTAFLPCVTFGQIAEVLDEGELTCPLGSFIYVLMMPALCSQWIMGSKYRTKLRKKYKLVEAPYEDVISHFFCPCCSLCQEFRELKNRGLDPALGWNGIQAEQQGKVYRDRQFQNPPPTQAMYK
ncbi:unnamed protein product [Ilex paraguariensis]|uniref:Protein PLANT CADMIUM RESISTANCE 8 n=1 Tax=Ilex paraguariensis TaxID=185542 RepID=A0ABC8T077_9AQUA